MIISHRHRFTFIHNPKTAGTSLRTVLTPYHDDALPTQGILQRPPFDYPLDFAHLRLAELAVLSPSVISAAQAYRSLVFVRDPYKRFVSAIDQVFKTFYPDMPLLTLQPEEHVLIVETFVEKMLCLETVWTDYRFVHLSPQVCFLQLNGLRLPSDVVPMDDRGAFILRGLGCLGLPPFDVPHDNPSRLDLTHLLSSRKVRAFVRAFYADDFAFFAADPALAHLAVAADTTHAQGHSMAEPPDLASSLRRVSSAVTAAQASDAHAPMDAAELAAEIDQAAADLAAGRMQNAFDRMKIVIMRNPDCPRALGMLGQIAVFAGLPAIGLAPLQRAVAGDPRLEHRIWLALCLAKLDCAEDSVRVMSAAIETIPPTSNAHFAVGMVFHALGHHEQAARHYSKCVALDARRADAQYRCARALQAAGRSEAAVDAYLQAIQICSTEANYYTDLSAELSALGRFEEACAAGKTAVERDPACAVAHNNLGHALLNLNRSADAVAAYEKAIEICDAYPKAQLGRALALLKSGDFERGWQQYEWRWQDGQRPRLDLSVPVWRGEDVRRRRILLHAEQGLGDTLQFVRFAPLVAARGAHVVLEVPPSLVRLMRHVEGVAEVIACGDPVPPIDVHCPMASLPLAFDMRLDTIPAAPYLHVPPEARSPPNNDSLIRGSGLVVGLVWAGDPRQSDLSLNRVDRRRHHRILDKS